MKTLIKKSMIALTLIAALAGVSGQTYAEEINQKVNLNALDLTSSEDIATL